MLAKAEAGRHALLVADTGAGKTLAGFLPTLCDFAPSAGKVPGDGLHTLYVSPLKALAQVLHAKRCEMVAARDATRITGYVVGGISPFGQKRMLSTVIDESAVLHTTIFVSGGRRGLDIEVGAVDLIAALHATLGAIATAND